MFSYLGLNIVGLLNSFNLINLQTLESTFETSHADINMNGAGADLEVRHSNTEESVLFYKGKQCIYWKLHR